jgi:hypothetical protein
MDALIAKLEEHGQYVHDMFDDRIEAVKEHREAIAAAHVARLTFQNARNSILLEHRENPKALGPNEETREAAILELVHDEHVAVFEAEREEARTSGALEVARLYARQAEDETEILKMIHERTPVEPNVRAPIPSQAPVTTKAINVQTPRPEDTFEAAEIARKNLDRNPTAAAPPIGARMILDTGPGPVAVTVTRNEGINPVGWECVQVQLDGTQTFEGGLNIARLTPVNKDEERRLRDLGWKPVAKPPAIVITGQTETVAEDAGSLLAKASESASTPKLELAPELLLSDGTKVLLRAVSTTRGELSVEVIRIGKRGGEKRIGSMCGPAGALGWDARTANGISSVAGPHLGEVEALDFILNRNGLALAPEPASKPAQGNVAVTVKRDDQAKAKERVMAGKASEGDGKLLYGGVAWQRGLQCHYISVNFLEVTTDASMELIGDLTGRAYEEASQVDTEALAVAVAGYHHDRGLMKGFDSPPAAAVTPTVEEAAAADGLDNGIDPSAIRGNDPQRVITDAEADYARAMAARGDIGPAQLRQIVRDECEPATDVDSMRLSEYQHLIYRVLPPMVNKALKAKEFANAIFVDQVEVPLEQANAPELEDDFALV